MATNAPQTDPNRSGLSTSEGKLALLAFVVGTVLEVVLVPLLQQFHATHPSAAWVNPALVMVGLVLQVTSLFGYTRSRTAVKVALLAQDVPAPVVNLQAAGPIPPELMSAIQQVLVQARAERSGHAGPPAPGGLSQS